MLATPLFPLGVQVVLLALVLLLAVNGWGLGLDVSPEDLLTLRKANLTTLVVWGLWWPAMIAVAVVAGRAWCTVCPLELAHRAGDALARRIGWPRARLGRVLRAGWAVVGAYLVLQLLVAGFSIHRVPHATALFLLVLVGAALASGLLVRDARAFCRAFCPAGALLSVYGRATPLQLDVRDPNVCAGCTTRDCVAAEKRHRLDRRSCPSLLAPFDREPSDGCVLCLQCAKVCPRANIGLGLVAADSPARRHTLLRPYEVAFVLVAFGFVSHEVIGEVPWLDDLFHRGPDALSARMPGLADGWLEAAWFLGLFPLAAWVTVGLLGRTFGARGGFFPTIREAATAAAPVIAVAHLAKAVAKAAAWAGYLPLAIGDASGLQTTARIAAHTLAAPHSLLSIPQVGWGMLALVLGAGWRAWRARAADGPLETPAAWTARASVATWFVAAFVTWGLS